METTIENLLFCPICNAKNQLADKIICTGCGEDLTLLGELRDLPKVYFNEGLRLAKEERFNEALEKLIIASEMKKDYIKPLVVIGKIYTQKGLYDEAIAYWKKALKIEPENGKVRACIERAEHIKREQYQIKKEQIPKVKVQEIVDKEVQKIKHRWKRFIIAGVTTGFIVGILPYLFQITIFSKKTPIVYQIKEAFEKNPTISGWGIKVQEREGIISVQGEVPTKRDVWFVTSIAKAVGRVDEIDDSKLKVRQYIELAEKVKGILKTDNRTNFLNIEVQQVDTHICLKGKVYTPFLRNLVKKIVKSVEGVNLVDNEIEVNPYYQVQPEDSLWLIAKKVYGDSEKWRKIYNANRDKITKPNIIIDYDTLFIPSN